jgi:hypothetical protein
MDEDGIGCERCHGPGGMHVANPGRDPETYWRRAVQANPWMPAYRENLATLLVHKRAWDEARPHCQAWVRLAPDNVPARKLWVTCLLKEGKQAEAKTEFEKIERLKPPNLQELRDWFAGQTGTR